MNKISGNVSTVSLQATQLSAVLNYGLYISDDIYNFVQLYLSIGSGTVMSVLGTAASVVIIVVYYKQGVRDSATISYISLAIADAGLCFLTLCVILCTLIESYFPLPEADLLSVQFVYIAYTRAVTHHMSTFATVYLALELCICITIPLKVKLMFTKTRSIIVNCSLLVFSIACTCPAWATQRLDWQYNPRFNRSRLTLALTGGRYGVEIYLGIFNGNTILITCQIVSIMCAILLISGIKKSAAFRKQAAIIQATTPALDFVPNGTIKKIHVVGGKQKVASDKYTKLAKVTVLLTIVFLICNIPVMTVSLTKTILPGLIYNQKLYGTLYFMMYASTLINSSVNILVYYYASERFRTTLIRIFICKRSHCKKK